MNYTNLYQTPKLENHSDKKEKKKLKEFKRQLRTANSSDNYKKPKFHKITVQSQLQT
jgi:hypothetical protein